MLENPTIKIFHSDRFLFRKIISNEKFRSIFQTTLGELDSIKLKED